MKGKNDYAEFVAIMGAAAEMLNQPKLTPLGLEMAFVVLQDHSIEDVKRAIYATLRESPCIPTPSDIIRHLEGTAEDRGSLAWWHVVRAIRKYGHYESVAFDDPAIHYAIDRMGGWQKVCNILEEELPFREREFIKLYARGERCADWDSVPKRFLGFHEINNIQGGWEVPETAYIQTKKESQAKLKSGEKDGTTDPYTPT